MHEILRSVGIKKNAGCNVKRWWSWEGCSKSLINWRNGAIWGWEYSNCGEVGYWKMGKCRSEKLNWRRRSWSRGVDRADSCTPQGPQHNTPLVRWLGFRIQANPAGPTCTFYVPLDSNFNLLNYSLFHLYAFRFNLSQLHILIH